MNTGHRPGTHGGLEPSTPVSLDPQCHTCSRHLPPSWRFRGEKGWCVGGGLRAGSGAGSGSGLCSARASVGASSVGPQSHRTEAAVPDASASSYARARSGGRRGPIRDAAALMDSPRPGPQYCSCPPPSPPHLRKVAAPPRGRSAAKEGEVGDPGDHPLPRGEKPGDLLGPLRRGQ